MSSHHDWMTWQWLACAVAVLIVCPVAAAAPLVIQCGNIGTRVAESIYPGSEILAQIRSGQVQSHTLPVMGAQQVRLLLAEDDPELQVLVCSPNGRAIRRARAGFSGLVLLSFAALEPGSYSILVAGDVSARDSVSYRLRVESGSYKKERSRAEIAAEDVVLAANALREGQTAAALRAAFAKYEDGRRRLAATGSPADEVIVLACEGEVLLDLSEYDEALHAYESALTLARTLPAGLRAHLLNGIARLQLDRYESRPALRRSEEALALSREANDPREETEALNIRAQAHFLESSDAEAMSEFQAALAIAESEGDRRGIARSLFGIGCVYFDSGQLDRTLEYVSLAEKVWRDVGDLRNEATTIKIRGTLLALRGEQHAALQLHSTVLKLFQEMGLRRGEAYTLNDLAFDYSGLKEYRTALEYLQRALGLFRQLGNFSGQVAALGESCVAHQALGEFDAALRDCSSAATLVQRLHDPRREAISVRQIADVQGLLAHTDRVAEMYTRAVELSRAANDPRGEADALRSLGKLRTKEGDPEAALALFAKALPLSKAGEDPEGVIATHYEIARAQRARSNLAEARKELEEALRLAEAQRSRVGSEALRSSYFTSVRQSYELYAQVLMDLHQQQPEAGLDRLALEQSEKAHARTLLDALVERGAEADQARDPQTVRRIRDLRSQIEAASYERMRLLAYGGSRKQLDANIERIRLLNAEYDTLRSAPVETGAATATGRIPSLTVEQIQQEVLDPDTTLLEYLLGDEGSMGWAVTRQRVISFALPPRRALESEVQRWHSLMLARKPHPGESAEAYGQRVRRADRELKGAAAKLACALVGPAMSQLNTRRLAIVPDGGLEYVAFGALPLDGCGEPHPSAPPQDGAQAPAQPLATRFEIVAVPSASSVLALRRQLQTRPAASANIAILADPVFTADDPRVGGAHRPAPHVSGPLGAAMRDLGWNSGIPRLPGTRLEAKTIAAHAAAGGALVALDFDASLATALRPELSRYRILHFATHGLLDAEQPEFSGLVLSLVDRKGKDENGYLSTQDIYEQHLLAELVVLSACDSGLGQTLRGEGVVGLARAFLHAGAARVVSSLWKIDDDATSELMRHFYDGVLRDRKPPAAALRYAQIQMMRQKRWSAPFYWAGFVLNGEWR